MGYLDSKLAQFQYLCDLKEIVLKCIPGKTSCDGGQTRIFAATKDGGWLPDNDEAVVMLQKGAIHKDILRLTKIKLQLDEQDTVGKWLKRTKMPKPQSGQIHVLLQIPKPTSPQIFPEGIIVQLPHLSRELVVEELLHDVLSAQFVPIISPTRSGKTSLLNLFAARYPAVLRVPISLSNVNSVASDLLLRYGVDVGRQECALPIQFGNHELVVFVLDDAQYEYEDSCFWERLIKISLGWLPSNVRFVISTSHPVEAVVHDCSLAFEGFAWKLTRDDLLLSDDEARQLLKPKHGLRPGIRSSILEELIIRECNGHVGSLLNVVEGITRMHRITRCNEHDLVRFCLSDRLLKNISPCFGKKIIAPSPPVAEFLAKTLVGELNYEPWQWSFEERQSLVSLKAAGFVVTDKNLFIQFTSPLAKRCYSKFMFPCRGDAEPSSIEGLIKQVIKTTSVSQLSEAAKSQPKQLPECCCIPAFVPTRACSVSSSNLLDLPGYQARVVWRSLSFRQWNRAMV